MKKSWLDKYAKDGKVDYWDELTKAKYGQNMLNMTDEQIAMVRDTNRVTDDPLMIPGSPRVKAKDGENMQGGGVAPFVTSDKNLYNQRKNRYNDSLAAYNYAKLLQLSMSNNHTSTDRETHSFDIARRRLSPNAPDITGFNWNPESRRFPDIYTFGDYKNYKPKQQVLFQEKLPIITKGNSQPYQPQQIQVLPYVPKVQGEWYSNNVNVPIDAEDVSALYNEDGSQKYKQGGMIKRADGSYSKRGLWDNIRANAGSGKKPTKEMLQQEKKIKASENAKYGKKLKGLTKQQQLQVAQSEQHLPYQDMDPAMANLYQGVVKANDLFKSTAVNKKADLLYKRYNEQAGAYLSRPEYKNSPLKAEHIAEAAKRLYKDTNYEFPLDLALAQAQFESGLGTHLKTKNNVWNVGNYGDGTRTTDFDSPEASAYNYMQLMYDKYLDKGKKNVDDLIQKGMINTEGNRYDPTNPKYEEVIGKQIKTIRKRIPGIGQPYNTTGKVSANEQIPVYPDQPIQVPIAKDGKLLAPSTPYPDMDPAMLKQYQLMEELSTAAGRSRINKEKTAIANKAKDKETRQYMMEKAAQQRAESDASMFSPSFWKKDSMSGRTPQQRLDDMGTDLQTRVFQTGNKTYDSYLNTPGYIAHMAGNLAKAPLKAQQQNSYMPYVSAIAEPLAVGAGEAVAGPYIKKMFGKKPVVYGESNVAPEEYTNLYRIQSKNAKTTAQLAAEGKLPKGVEKNLDYLKRKANEEKYFGQWFTKEPEDIEWYIKDREFLPEEIEKIQLKVPNSELAKYQNYDKALSRASDREFVIPHDIQKKYLIGESNVAPHDPYSSVEKIKYPSTWQGPARTTKTVPLTPENAPYLTDVTPLTKEQEILKSFGLDPNNPGKIPNAFINRANSSKGAIDVPKQMVDIYKEILRQSKLKPYVGKNANQALFDFKQRIETPEGIKRMQELGINNPNILRSLHIKGDPISEGMFMSPPMGDRYIGLHPNLDDQFTKPIVRHEIEHAVQENIYRNAIENLNRSNVDWDTYKGTVPNTSSIDKLLEGIELKKEAIPLPPRTPKEYIENPNDIIERLKDKQDATDYFMYGSDGKEKAPFLGELQQHLVDNGYIKHPYDKITPDILKSAHFDHRNSNGYPIRILNIMKPTDKNYEILAQGLNKMLGVAAPVGLGAAALSQNNKKYGGKITNNWLQKY